MDLFSMTPYNNESLPLLGHLQGDNEGVARVDGDFSKSGVSSGKLKRKIIFHERYEMKQLKQGW